MRQWEIGRIAAIVAVLALTGAGPGKTPAPKKKPEPPLKVRETVGDLAKVPPMAEVRVEGVGLVIGLERTGSDPEPSAYRQALLDRMRKDGLPNAERWLASETTSLVLIKGRIPAGITTSDVLDVEIELPFTSKTTSLVGGKLIKADLRQVGLTAEGQRLPDGQVMATASGPVLIGSDTNPDDPRIGRILGGGRVKKDRNYVLMINEKRKSVRTAAIVQSVVNSRFSRLRGIDQEGMAKAKSDLYLDLMVPANYHHNQYRFFQVVENLSVVDNPQLRAVRMEQWGRELLDPKTAGQAAIRLEGIGRNASDVLKTGLSHPHPQVRFFAAEALAYVGDEAGATVLADAVANQPSFRAYALAALAALDEPAARLKLRGLMAHPNVEVRYGAFNALRTAYADDPYLGRVRVLHDEPEPEPEDGDAMALQIAAPRKKPMRSDPFALYVVDCEGPPMIHLSKTRRCEIVVFGRGQKLLTPLVLGTGPYQVNAIEGDQTIWISRIGSEAIDGPDQKIGAAPEVGSVICELANLGASYPEILALLQSADRQKNLPGDGALVIDAVPTALPAYDQAQIAGTDATAKKDPAVGRAGAEAPVEKRPRKSLIDRVLRK